jgi:Undecaprenyl-phosphate galactose phosphotransferase WbaP
MVGRGGAAPAGREEQWARPEIPNIRVAPGTWPEDAQDWRPESALPVPASRIRAARTVRQVLAVAPIAAGDALVVSASLYAVAGIAELAGVALLSSTAGVALAVSGILLIQFAAAGLFSAWKMNPFRETRQTVVHTALAFLMAGLAAGITGAMSALQLAVLIPAALACCVLLPVTRPTLRAALAKTSWWSQRVLIIGEPESAESLRAMLDRRAGLGLKPIAILELDESSEAAVNAEAEGHSASQETAELTVDADWAFVVMPSASPRQINQVIETHAAHIPRRMILSDSSFLPSLWTETCDFAGQAGIACEEGLVDPIALKLKRTLDVAIVVASGLCLLPVLAVICALIRVASPGPIFFGHTRIGQGGRRFKAWKFRSMVLDADKVLEQHLKDNPELQAEWDNDQKLRNDPRIIRGIGPVLRKLSLDELPQLWNVLKGEMSLVGPRPIVDNETEKYGEVFPLYLRVTPGITGLWQISGRNNTTYEERVAYDQYYVRNWSVWSDLYILAATVRTVLLREGAY